MLKPKLAPFFLENRKIRKELESTFHKICMNLLLFELLKEYRDGCLWAGFKWET